MRCSATTTATQPVILPVAVFGRRIAAFQALLSHTKDTSNALPHTVILVLFAFFQVNLGLQLLRLPPNLLLQNGLDQAALYHHMAEPP